MKFHIFLLTLCCCVWGTASTFGASFTDTRVKAVKALKQSEQFLSDAQKAVSNLTSLVGKVNGGSKQNLVAVVPILTELNKKITSVVGQVQRAEETLAKIETVSDEVRQLQKQFNLMKKKAESAVKRAKTAANNTSVVTSVKSEIERLNKEETEEWAKKDAAEQEEIYKKWQESMNNANTGDTFDCSKLLTTSQPEVTVTKKEASDAEPASEQKSISVPQTSITVSGEELLNKLDSFLQQKK